MAFRFLVRFAVSSAALLSIHVVDARAGAFMTPEGQGQIIAGVGYVAATRTFDRSGKAVTAPSFQKADFGAYLEYGLKDWLTLVVAPIATTMRSGGDAHAYQGSDTSAFGARLRLFGTTTGIVAIQALLQPPLGNRRDVATEVAFGGPNVLAVDLRLQVAQDFSVFGWPSFIDLEPGARLRSGDWPNEARVDAAFGVRPTPDRLVMLQSFTSFAPSGGSAVASFYSKLQIGVVQDLTRAWSVQVGGARTVVGRNAAREFGPFASLWYRF